MDVIIEKANVDHLEIINKIANQAQELHVAWRNDIFKSSSNIISDKMLEELIDSNSIFVAKYNDLVIGYMMIGIKDRMNIDILVPKKYLVIDNLAVDKSYQRLGVGTKLISFAEKLGKSLGCTDLYLTVNPENQVAINSYEKYGFKILNIAYSKTINK